jgi:signal transduction histidine kinase
MVRNRTFRQFTFWFVGITALSTLLGFVIHPAAGFLALASAAAYGSAFWIYTRARYNSLAQLSHQIDRVLHNEDHLLIGEADEGELSILHSEITKMTSRIRDQNIALKKEKEHLANSLADIAHQLRTPLTSVNLILSLLANNPEEQERKAFLRETEELLVRMDWLLTSLLKLSRLDAGIVVFQSGPVNVARLVHDALRPLLIPLELREVELHINVPEEAVIQGDTGWLAEALQNILKNGMENAGEHGRIEISCTDNLLYTEIAVRDSGQGFEQEDMRHLFDRFYRGKSPNATGYGIGLALCKMIITRQGGTITARNHPEGGAIFTLRFPK